MTDRAAIQSVIEALSLTVTSEFVPFSQSRNKGEKHKSLNWRVTVFKGDKAILTTDYMAGVAHCPAYKETVKALGNANSLVRANAIAYECENGFNAVWMEGYNHISKGKWRIEPDALDVLYSLSSDADVLEYSSFEEWATNVGYDTDSREDEQDYRECLGIALKLRNALNDDGLSKLREAFQDY